MKKATYNRPVTEVTAMNVETCILAKSWGWSVDGQGQGGNNGNPPDVDSKEEFGGNLWAEDDQDWD